MEGETPYHMQCQRAHRLDSGHLILLETYNDRISAVIAAVERIGPALANGYVLGDIAVLAGEKYDLFVKQVNKYFETKEKIVFSSDWELIEDPEKEETEEEQEEEEEEEEQQLQKKEQQIDEEGEEEEEEEDNSGDDEDDDEDDDDKVACVLFTERSLLDKSMYPAETLEWFDFPRIELTEGALRKFQEVELEIARVLSCGITYDCGGCVVKNWTFFFSCGSV